MRKLIDGDLRLRTACDLEPVNRENLVTWRPDSFKLPSLPELENALKFAIEQCKDLMVHTTVTFEDELKKAKDAKKSQGVDDSDENAMVADDDTSEE